MIEIKQVDFVPYICDPFLHFKSTGNGGDEIIVLKCLSALCQQTFLNI